MTLDETVLQQLVATLNSSAPKAEQLNGALRLLAKWRSTLIQNSVLRQSGTVVASGPFQGMQFLRRSAEGCHAPKLLGCYEREIHAVIEQIVRIPYAAVLNVGCAEGYYAVGLARLMPQTKVYAHDTDERARSSCRELAEQNGVAERVCVGGTVGHEAIAAFAGQKTLLICDIEGAERELLEPAVCPALRDMDLLVESHDCFIPGLSDLLASRFRVSHSVEKISQSLADRQLPDQCARWGDLDRLLAIWEWRTGPTPWLWMQARAG
jgi:predicted O-methyltransferase YrrM